jgi:hypothetical protein
MVVELCYVNIDNSITFLIFIGFLAEVEQQGLVWKEQTLPVESAAGDKCNLQCPRLFVLSKKAA